MKVILVFLCAIFFTTPALAQVEMQSDELQRAALQAKIFEEANNAETLVDQAVQIGIVVSVPQTPTATIILKPTDAEWADIVAIIKGAAVKKKADANAELDKLGLKAKPTPPREDPTPDPGPLPGPER